MQFTAMKVLGGLALGMMATSVIAAPTANTDVSARGAQGVDVPNSEPFAYSTDAASAHDLINSMISTNDSTVHVGDDGVARSFAGNGTVIDYRQLSNSQLKAIFNSMPPSVQHLQAHFTDVYANVDGHQVTNETQLWDPAPEFRPQETDEQAEDEKRSVNPMQDAANKVAGRQSYAMTALYCIGARCSTSRACQLMGCGACGTYDKSLTTKVCW